VIGSGSNCKGVFHEKYFNVRMKCKIKSNGVIKTKDIEFHIYKESALCLSKNYIN
jgi:hypothetical protein